MKLFRGRVPGNLPGVSYGFYGGWLDNSIFISMDLGRFPVDDYFNGRYKGYNASMGIKDTNPVTGVYRGGSATSYGHGGEFELNYTSGATGGQLDMTLRDHVLIEVPKIETITSSYNK